jgi:hypothetical protein
MFILLIIKYVNEPLLRKFGSWALRCSRLQNKTKEKYLGAQNQAKVYKNNMNFTRLFSVVCHRHQIKYLLFDWNFTEG